MASKKQRKAAKAKTQARMKAAKAAPSEGGKVHVRAYERRRPRKR